jgi:hypothetical protein
MGRVCFSPGAWSKAAVAAKHSAAWLVSSSCKRESQQGWRWRGACLYRDGVGEGGGRAVLGFGGRRCEGEKKGAASGMMVLNVIWADPVAKEHWGNFHTQASRG